MRLTVFCLRLRRGGGEEVDIYQHSEAHEERNQAASSHVVSGHEPQQDRHADADSRHDQSTDLQSFDRMEPRDPALFPHVLDGGFGAVAGSLAHAAKCFSFVEGFALLALAFEPGGNWKKDSEERHCAY